MCKCGTVCKCARLCISACVCTRVCSYGRVFPCMSPYAHTCACLFVCECLCPHQSHTQALSTDPMSWLWISHFSRLWQLKGGQTAEPDPGPYTFHIWSFVWCHTATVCIDSHQAWNCGVDIGVRRTVNWRSPFLKTFYKWKDKWKAPEPPTNFLHFNTFCDWRREKYI